MVIFSLKLLNNVRKAIAGRKYPHQLAGGVALGVLLGIIPHGNLLALAVLIAVLCFKVNHALLGVVAIAISFVATRLDSYSHQVGEAILTHPQGAQWAKQAWSMPLVAWTDLNNTVVMGSFVIGLVSVLPIFAIALPLFQKIAPAESERNATSEATDSEATDSNAGQQYADALPQPQTMTVPFAPTDNGQPEIKTGPAPAGHKHAVALYAQSQETPAETIRIDNVLATEPEFLESPTSNQAMSPTQIPRVASPAARSNDDDPLPTQEQMASIETRIDVIRITDFRGDGAQPLTGSNENEGGRTVSVNGETDQTMDEALNYLLHQLRHSQQRKAAG